MHPPSKWRLLESAPCNEETQRVSTGGLVQPAASESIPRPTPRERLRAAKRALIVLSEILDLRLIGSAVRTLTRRPRTENVEIAGVPAQFVVPAGRGPWPAFVFVTGAHPLRRREPIVQRLAEGLGRAGFAVLVPDLPGLGEGEITPRTTESAFQVVEWTLRREEVKEGRIVLCGASVGASLALVVAEQPELADSISVVASVCPFANLEKMICLATTLQYGDDDEPGAFDAAILLRRVVARSLLATLPQGPERTELLARVGSILLDDEDPIESLRAIEVGRLEKDAGTIVRLLTNSDAGKFRELYDGLPDDARALIEGLSPLPQAGRVRARVELAVPPLDPYFPPGETQTLAAALPSARLTVSATLDHTRPMMSRARVGDLARFCGFVLRSLADS
jgi:pimeloyl-ACP methyl ester carboxylesterase